MAPKVKTDGQRAKDLAQLLNAVAHRGGERDAVIIEAVALLAGKAAAVHGVPLETVQKSVADSYAEYLEQRSN